ncbi:UNVERIFIED_ORG: hypothetical protein GGD59_002289 [Rhizobium esperanzae]
MLDRRILQHDDDYAPVAIAAGSVEPFRKPDHKAKRHPKPRNVDCRGRFALRRQKPGRALAEIGGDE